MSRKHVISRRPIKQDAPDYRDIENCRLALEQDPLGCERLYAICLGEAVPDMRDNSGVRSKITGTGRKSKFGRYF